MLTHYQTTQKKSASLSPIPIEKALLLFDKERGYLNAYYQAHKRVVINDSLREKAVNSILTVSALQSIHPIKSIGRDWSDEDQALYIKTLKDSQNQYNTYLMKHYTLNDIWFIKRLQYLFNLAMFNFTTDPTSTILSSIQPIQKLLAISYDKKDIDDVISTVINKLQKSCTKLSQWPTDLFFNNAPVRQNPRLSSSYI